MALHREMMAGMGHNPAPLRDPGLLESAIHRPEMAAYYEDADLIRQAALLAVGIAQNQPYVDGNKRTAYIALTVFLRVNGHPLVVNRLEVAKQLEVVATRADRLEAATARFEAWLREHVDP